MPAVMRETPPKIVWRNGRPDAIEYGGGIADYPIPTTMNDLLWLLDHLNEKTWFTREVLQSTLGLIRQALTHLRD